MIDAKLDEIVEAHSSAVRKFRQAAVVIQSREETYRAITMAQLVGSNLRGTELSICCWALNRSPEGS